MMAQLFPPPQPPARVSQLLPTVKCSSCSAPVPLNELGEHVCAKLPAVSPVQATSLLPQRLQSLVSPAASVSSHQRGSTSTARSPLSPSRHRDPYTPAASSPLREGPPSIAQLQTPSRSRATSIASTITPASASGTPSYRGHSAAGISVASSAPELRSPPPTPYIPEDVDTKTGGEAGMAGVGRRGFAAVARAAMFTTGTGQGLNIDTNIASNGTPPLSAGSYSSSQPTSAGPVSPLTQSPERAPTSVLSTGSGMGGAVSPLDKLRMNGTVPPSIDTYRGDAATPTARTAPQPKRGCSRDDSADVVPPSPDPSSGSEYGLAYAESTDYEEEPLSPRGPPEDRVEQTSAARIAQALGLAQTPPFGGPGARASGNRARRDSDASGSNYSRSTASASGGYFSGVNPSEVSGPSASSAGGGMGGLEAAMSALQGTPKGKQRMYEDPAAAAVGTNARKPQKRSNTVQTPRSPTVAMAPKLPTRARTERESRIDSKRDRERERRAKARVCVRCEKRIEDGRWIQVDGGGVLCERCWKNMYLPKCRRCSLPIEKQAVSSSDGQLKGKYHKECFNCHTCHKPFPDKTFYVYDGKPFCGYHYHEANNSLCAADTCGAPIEGPCAVSHTGDRYHSEHLTCEHPAYPPCRERLEEYWDVDGRMLCERHARLARAALGGADGEEGEGWAGERAMRRKTRFIDLAGYGAGVGSGGESDGEGLR